MDLEKFLIKTKKKIYKRGIGKKKRKGEGGVNLNCDK